MPVPPRDARTRHKWVNRRADPIAHRHDTGTLGRVSETDSIPGPDPDVPRHFPQGNYRRRIRLVVTAPGVVDAGVEDDLHYFTVRLEHDGERVQTVAAGTVREPWSTCRDAAVPLEALEGMDLAPSCLAVGTRTKATHNCTHMFDLAGLAVAHAWRVTRGGAPRRQYDIEVPYSPLVRGRTAPRDLTLLRDGTPVLTFTTEGLTVTGPEPYAPADAAGGFFRWAERTLSAEEAEAAIVLKRATIIGLSRGVDLDRHDRLEQLPELAPVCYSMQPEQAAVALRRKGQIRDYDADPEAMLASGPF